MANDNITIKIKAINETSGSINEINNSLDNTENKVKTLSKNINNIGSNFSSLKGIVGATSGVLATLSITDFLAQIIDTNNEFSSLNAKMIALSNNSLKAAKDFETIKKFEGIFRFDTKDIQETYNILRSQNIEFNESILRTISDTALATNQNIVTVTEQFRAVLNGEEASLDDYFKSVVKTTDGILVQYTTKNGELKTKLLKDQNDMAQALNEQFSGVTDTLNKTSAEQLKIYRQNFFNKIGEELSKLELSFYETLQRITNFKSNTDKEELLNINTEKIDRANDRLKQLLILKEKNNLTQIEKEDFVALFESLNYGALEYESLNEEQKKYFENSNVINNINAQNKQKQDDLNESLEGSLVLYKDLNKQLKEIKDIKGIDSFLSKLDKNQKNILSSNLELLKQDAEKQKQLITNLENEKIDIKIKKMNLETRVLKGDNQAKIELIKLNSSEEIKNLTETGERKVALEKSILLRQSVEIDNFNKDLLEKEKDKNEKLEKLNKERLEKQRELNNKLNKINEEISILKINNNNDLNQFEKDNIINKRNLLARQRDELNVKDLTNEEKNIIRRKTFIRNRIIRKRIFGKKKKIRNRK